jgi:2-polyprenyl-3-methyl-5-hydroxy-6-metoxy-1,4-benzoquinol methylase
MNTFPAPDTRPFDAAAARRIASIFLPRWALGNRYDYYYCLGKLRSDPLYPGVLAALRGTTAPVLDLGCGLGLLAHALHDDGQTLGYYGVDNDADKIARGRDAAARRGIADARFEVVDLARRTPEHTGSVAILDVLQYLEPDAQIALLRTTAAMLTPGARLVIRSGLDDASSRARTSKLGDRLANWVGWMQFRPRSLPTRERIVGTLESLGLRVQIGPLYGNTPFNNWLIVAER